MYAPDSASDALYPTARRQAGLHRGQIHTQPMEPVRALCHDIRQPLTALRLMIESSVGRPTDRVLQGMLDQIKWLDELVESVLGEHGQERRSVVPLANVVGDAVALAFTDASCEHTIDVDAAAKVVARPKSLARAVMCVLDNAIRAAGKKGHVAIAVSEYGRQAVVSVADNGPGLGRLIPQHALGLPIARAILADCGGVLTLRDRASGGVVAELRLPLAAWTVGP